MLFYLASQMLRILLIFYFIYLFIYLLISKYEYINKCQKDDAP